MTIEQLKMFLNETKLKKKEAATYFGMTPQHLSRILNNQYPIPAYIDVLCTAYIMKVVPYPLYLKATYAS